MTFLRLVDLSASITKVLEYAEIDESDGIIIGLMLILLGITNSLSKALQREDQDIMNAMSLVKSTKQQLYKIRDDE
uniref:Uncharacterized protein n=1 Tax=Brassica oleracea var. oleracea TaxID=109376 RepID=A0A0D3CSV2_BRAOL